MEEGEVSLNQVKVFDFVRKSEGWVTAAEIATGSGVVPRTVRHHVLKLVKLGIFDQAEIFSAHRYRVSEHADKHNAAYVLRLHEAIGVLDSQRSCILNGNQPPIRVGLMDHILSNETYDLPSDWKTRRWQSECETAFRKKYRLNRERYFTFLISAGVGSGKTIVSALIASFLLNRGAITRIIYVCPNLAIRRRVVEEFQQVNIHLDPWKRPKDASAIKLPVGSNGIVVTYQALMNEPEMYAKLCDSKSMVIFDEIHHLGDDLAWSDAAESAFKDRVACVLGLSGTPYRGDNRGIPFVEFETSADGLRVYKADFTYTLGRSIVDGVCRKPVFHWLDGDIKVILPDRTRTVMDFQQEAPLSVMNRRLNGAVRHGSASRAKALARVIEFCRRTGRKLIIFVGGDSNRPDAGGVRDATEFLPAELGALGIKPEEMVSVVAEDKRSPQRIRDFGKSNAWILIAVNMISEGVDIPVLSASLFLTCITARATTIQRIGRTVRGEGEAHIFLFADPRYLKIAELIEAEHQHEIDLGRTPPATVTIGALGPRDPEVEPVAIGLNCRENGITVGGEWYSELERLKYHKVMTEYGYPEGQAYMAVILRLIREGKYGPVNETGSPGVP